MPNTPPVCANAVTVHAHSGSPTSRLRAFVNFLQAEASIQRPALFRLPHLNRPPSKKQAPSRTSSSASSSAWWPSLLFLGSAPSRPKNAFNPRPSALPTRFSPRSPRPPAYQYALRRADTQCLRCSHVSAFLYFRVSVFAETPQASAP